MNVTGCIFRFVVNLNEMQEVKISPLNSEQLSWLFPAALEIYESLNVISRAGLEIIGQFLSYFQSHSVRKSLFNLPANYHAENDFRISNLSEIQSCIP